MWQISAFIWSRQTERVDMRKSAQECVMSWVTKDQWQETINASRWVVIRSAGQSPKHSRRRGDELFFPSTMTQEWCVIGHFTETNVIRTVSQFLNKISCLFFFNLNRRVVIKKSNTVKASFHLIFNKSNKNVRKLLYASEYATHHYLTHENWML